MKIINHINIQVTGPPGPPALPGWTYILINLIDIQASLPGGLAPPYRGQGPPGLTA